MQQLRWRQNRLLDRSALLPSALMVLAVVLVSFVKPLAFSRYFVVLLPSVLPLLSVVLTASPLHRAGQRLVLGVLVLLLISWWGPGFAELDTATGGVREQDQFRAISQLTNGERERYSPRARLFNLSDQMELAMGRITAPELPWGIGMNCGNGCCVHPCQTSCGWPAADRCQKLNRKLKPCSSRPKQLDISVTIDPKASAMVGCCAADRDPGPLCMRECAVVSGQASSRGPQVWGSTSNSSSAWEGG